MHPRLAFLWGWAKFIRNPPYERSDQLLGSLAILGLEVRKGHKIDYRQLPEVGQALILFGRTELWKRANEKMPGK